MVRSGNRLRAPVGPGSPRTAPDGYAAPAIDRMLDIVEFLLDKSRPYGVSELSRHVRISTNSVFRICKRLEGRGYLEWDEPGRGYKLGTGFYRVGVRLVPRFTLRDRARPHLAWLCGQTDQTVSLHVPDRDRVFLLDVLTPNADYYFNLVAGSRLFYHCNAMGKCILAHLPEENVRSILPRKLPATTPNTITSFDRLRKELERVRRTGLAFDRQEYTAGVFCIGAPVFGVDGKVLAGVGITGLSTHFDVRREKAVESAVREAARRISRDMGYVAAAPKSRPNDPHRVVGG
jgi:IclR family KDG regulon transcriptional repressor